MSGEELKKFEVKVKKMVKKIDKMTPDEYEKFIDGIIAKSNELKDKISKDESKFTKIKEGKREREYTSEAMTLIAIASELSCIIAGGTIEGIMNGPEGIFGGAVCGLMAGLLIAILNAVCYTEMPISNFLNDVKAKVLESKLKKNEKGLMGETYCGYLQ